MNEEIIEAGPQIAESKMIWSVFTNTDLTEGRGTEYAVYNCTDKTTARRLAQRAGVMGSPAPIKPQIAIKLEGNRFWHVPGLLSKPSAADMKQIEKDERHEKALQAAKDAGLSEETIAILEKGA